MRLIGIILTLLVLGVLSATTLVEDNRDNALDVCRGKLTDLEYLEHMIPHHQVAIDVSEAYAQQSNNPAMQSIIRKLIWTQKREIAMMHEYKLIADGEKGMSDHSPMQLGYAPRRMGNYVFPNSTGLSQAFCDPAFFDPKLHEHHTEMAASSDAQYIAHMIPHHQVAVDMSKVLLQNTSNDYMISLAHRIIQSQQEEIALLQSYTSNNHYTYNSGLVS